MPYFVIVFQFIWGLKSMENKVKKYTALILCSIFFLSLFTSVNAIDVKKQLKIEDEQESCLKKIIEEYEDLAEYSDEICKYFSLLDENESSNESAFNIYKNVRVLSSGRGFHFKTRYKIKIVFINRILEKLLPMNRNQFFRPFVFGNYNNDSKANTYIFKAAGYNETIHINGSHLVLFWRFNGITSWFRKIEKSPVDLLPRLIIGKADYLITYKY